jgi:hypothetical protein
MQFYATKSVSIRENECLKLNENVNEDGVKKVRLYKIIGITYCSVPVSEKLIVAGVKYQWIQASFM